MPKLLLSIFAVTAMNAHAVDRILVRCATLLIAQAQHHSVPSISSSYTGQALNDLRRFRAQHLNAFEFTPSQATVSGHSTSLLPVRRRIAERISGLLEDQRSAIQVEQERAVRSKVYATVFEGPSLADELLARQSLRAKLYAQGHARHQVQAMISFALSPLMSLTVGYLAFTLTPATAMYVLPLMVPYRFLPELALRGLTSHTPARDFAATFAARLLKMAPGEWFYASEDRRLPLNLIRDIFRTREVSEEDWRREHRWRAFPKGGVALTGTRWTDDRFYEAGDAMKDGWVRRDELISVDAAGTPRLISVLRISEEIPPYARTAPKNVEQLSIRQPVLE